MEQMTRLLVSVRNRAEAQIALEQGVDLIDIKEPTLGSLGAAEMDVIAEIVRVVDRRVPLSAALGELVDAPLDVGEMQKLAGLSFVKWGLAGCTHIHDWPGILERAVSLIPLGVSPVAVVYADWRRAASPSPAAVLGHTRHVGCRAALVDTWRKNGDDLFAHWSDRELSQFVNKVQQAGMLAVIGGSLTRETLSRAVEAQPDFVAVRAAACTGSRVDQIDAGRIRELLSVVRSAGSMSRR